MVMPDLDSDLDILFKVWGIEVIKEKIAGDTNAAMHVQTRSARGQQEVSYLPWLSLGKESLNPRPPRPPTSGISFRPCRMHLSVLRL